MAFQVEELRLELIEALGPLKPRINSTTRTRSWSGPTRDYWDGCPSSKLDSRSALG